MASTGTNQGAKDILDVYAAAGTFRMLLLTGVSTSWQTAATARDFNFADEITADEASHASYSRQAATYTVTLDEATDVAYWTFANVTFASLAAAVGEIKGVVIIRLVNDDTDSPILEIHDVDSLDVTPDGNDLIVSAGSSGSAQLGTT